MSETIIIDNIADYLAQSVAARKKLIGSPPGYAYASVEDFVLQHGQAWKVAPRPKGIRQRKPKQCYDNAYKLVNSAQGQRMGLRYVEGYATSVIPLQHAWAVTPDGTVIDPTWTDTDIDGDPIAREYFGVELPPRLIDIAICIKGYYGVLEDWRNGYPLLQEPYEPEAATARLHDMLVAKGR
jgi:hypothetical protein